MPSPLYGPNGQPMDQYRASRSVRQRSRPYGAGLSLNQGGITNYGSGAGTHLDKSEQSFFSPTRIYWRAPLEILCVQSWAAANFVDIPIFDQFIRWRTFTSDDDGAVEAMEEAEQRHGVERALMEAQRAARQYGTGVIVMMSTEAPLESPLNYDQVREGDLKSLQYFDRYDISVTAREHDMFDSNFGAPVWYDLHPSHGGTPLRVHHSRVLRFDGIRPPTRSGFTIYDQDFGVSRLIPLIKSILQDESAVTAIAHMLQEASIPVLHVSGLRELGAAGREAGEPTPEQLGADINAMKSVFRLMMLDEPGRETFERVAIAFSGVADLLDRGPQRVAAAGRIPMTRFMGEPPKGMNATGESDGRNYIIMMEAERAKNHRATLEVLDMMLARDAGLSEPPGYEWNSLLELSDKDIAEAAKLKAEALHIAVDDGAIEEQEYRDAISGDPLFGPLPTLPQSYWDDLQEEKMPPEPEPPMPGDDLGGTPEPFE